MARIPKQWLKSILLTIYQRPAITRDEIVRSTGLNPASVSQALQQLLSSGTILKVGELKSRGGRRREVLKLNPEAGHFIAVDVKGVKGAKVRRGLDATKTSVSSCGGRKISLDIPFYRTPDMSVLARELHKSYSATFSSK